MRRSLLFVPLSLALLVFASGCKFASDGTWPPPRERAPNLPAHLRGPGPQPGDPVVRVGAGEAPRADRTSVLAALDESSLYDDRLPPELPKIAHVPAPWPFDVVHYDIDVRLDFRRQGIDGSVAITLLDAEDGLSAVTLDAVDLRIESVSDEDGRDLPYGHDGEKLRVELPPGRAGERRVIRVVYAGEPTMGLFFNLPGPGEPEAGLEAWTQGETEFTRHWLPCHDFPDDQATHEIHVDVPTSMTVMCAGEQVGPVVPMGERARWHYRMATPHVSYLITLVAGDLKVLREDGIVPLSYVVQASDVRYARSSLRKTDAILRFFGEYTGRPYAYPKYAQCCVRHYMFGGMENISATTLTDRTLHPPDWEPEKTSHSLVAHEAAHQWFGDLVTCADWSHIWLNEGFATYFDALFTEHDAGRDEFLLVLRGLRDGGLGAYDGDERAVVSNVYRRPFDLFNGHAYPGGAARLHMLRNQLGEAGWRRFVKLYVARRAGTVSRTEDLQAVAEEVAGEDLGWWFAQWLTGKGYPALKIRWKPLEGGTIEITVLQTQDAGKGHIQAFRVPLDIAFDLKDGSTETTRLDVTAREQSWTVDLSGPVRFVRPDPHTVLMARFDLERSGEEWAALLGVDPNPSRRIDAAVALGGIAKDHKREATDRDAAGEALRRALDREPLARVRVAIAAELAKRKGDDNREALAEALTDDDDLRVQIAAAKALGSYEANEDVAELLGETLESENDLLREAVVRALGRLKIRSEFDVIAKQLERPGWQSRAAQGALAAMGDLGDERGFDVLVRYVRAGEDIWARPAAIESLGRLGKKRPEYRDVLVPHLHDRLKYVRQKTAEALGAIGDVDTIPILVDALKTERWSRAQKALRGAVQACRKEALADGKLVTTEIVRAARLRERYWQVHGELKVVPASDPRRAALSAEFDTLVEQLDELGVGVGKNPAGK